MLVLCSALGTLTTPRQLQRKRMHISAGIAVGVGCACVAQVSSFAFAPLATTSSLRSGTQGRSHGEARVRSRGLALSMSTAGDDGWGDEPEEVEEEMASQVMTKKKKKGGELDDIMSEVAGRANDQPIVVPRNAGVRPMAPGPIKPDPIEGMDADDVPGKIILDADTLAEQQKGLEKIAQQLRRERLDKEAEDAITFGFCPRAELWNGRSAMFGVTVGMLTEFWTGQSIPQQVETFAQLIGLLPLDYDTYFQ